MHLRLAMGAGLLLAGSIGTPASADEPRPVPLTRPEMKQQIEDMKARAPRIPLPELTEQDRAGLDDRSRGYESRLRSLYLSSFDPNPGAPGSGGGYAGFGFGRDQDSLMTLDYAFKTELFWIVSRTNNCQYCLGHQESKLLRAGLTEDQIAALDGDWAGAEPAQREAYAYARKLTYEPNLLNDADIDALREHFTPLQILEMTVSVAGNNAINRWKEGVGVPQSSNGGGFGSRNPDGSPAQPPVAEPAEAHSYLTPTSEVYRDVITRVAPVVLDEQTGEPTRRTVSRRPDLESRAEVLEALEAARKREPRLPLVSEAEAQSIAPNGPDTPPQWVRLLANFPTDGARLVARFRAAEERGDLDPLVKAQAAWIVARQDRAWYATGLAWKRLRELGQTEDQIFALDGDLSEFAPRDRALFVVARKLAASPVVLTDAEVAEAVKLAGPRDVVQMVYYTTSRAAFHRITEAAGLALED